MAGLPAFQRAAIVEGYGGPAKLKEFLTLIADKPVPTPQPGEILVRMKARSVNPADGLAAMGFYPGFAPAALLPATLGLEGMGQVAATGPNVTAFQVGQRVVPLFALGYTMKGEGSYQEYVAVDAHHAVPVPDFLPDQLAAQLVINPVTVYGILKELQVPKGEYLLQTQAGSAVGRQLISLAKAQGIRTISVVRRVEAIQELKAIGADEVICSTSENVTARVLEITGGKGAYGALESVAGELTGQVISATRLGGTVLLFGGASGPTLSANIVDFIFRGVTLKGFWVNEFLKSMGASERNALFAEITGNMEKGILLPTCEKTFDLADFAVALKEQQTTGRQGKYVLTG